MDKINILISILIFIFFTLLHYNIYKIKHLRFSNTQTLGWEEKEIQGDFTDYHKTIVDQLNLKYKNYNGNDTLITKMELDDLVYLQHNRTKKDIENIKNELELFDILRTNFKLNSNEINRIGAFCSFN